MRCLAVLMHRLNRDDRHLRGWERRRRPLPQIGGHGANSPKSIPALVPRSGDRSSQAYTCGCTGTAAHGCVAGTRVAAWFDQQSAKHALTGINSTET